MMRPMRKTLIRLAAPVVLAIAAMPAVAQPGVPDEIPEHDARLEGFAKEGTGGPALLMLPQSGSAGSWFLTVLLGGLCFGVMCKSGKRTHLD